MNYAPSFFLPQSSLVYKLVNLLVSEEKKSFVMSKNWNFVKKILLWDSTLPMNLKFVKYKLKSQLQERISLRADSLKKNKIALATKIHLRVFSDENDPLAGNRLTHLQDLNNSLKKELWHQIRKYSIWNVVATFSCVHSSTALRFLQIWNN